MEYFFDTKRHLVCIPYSVENLHRMAADLGIKRHWYHSGDKPHYDIPKSRIADIAQKATKVTERAILVIIKTNGDYK